VVLRELQVRRVLQVRAVHRKFIKQHQQIRSL
jgi:hypothetical protein